MADVWVQRICIGAIAVAFLVSVACVIRGNQGASAIALPCLTALAAVMQAGGKKE